MPLEILNAPTVSSLLRDARAKGFGIVSYEQLVEVMGTLDALRPAKKGALSLPGSSGSGVVATYSSDSPPIVGAGDSKSGRLGDAAHSPAKTQTLAVVRKNAPTAANGENLVFL